MEDRFTNSEQNAFLRQIAEAFLNGKREFKVEEALKLGIDFNKVREIIQQLSGVHSVSIHGDSFLITNFEQFLLFWATSRRLNEAIVYYAKEELSAEEIENAMPDNTAFTAYSGFRYTFGEVPASYNQVHIYANSDAIEKIKKQFSGKGGDTYLFVLKPDKQLAKLIEEEKVRCVSLPQMFVDIWNTNAPYATAFLKELEVKMNIGF
jgi:hypothetical protein